MAAIPQRLGQWMAAGLLSLPLAAAANTDEPKPSGATAALSIPNLPFEKYTLDNGLEVILHRDDGLPLVAVNLWYHVGPVNEPKGRSGFAHLFEHLMFEGSRHVGREFDRLLESVGATNVNGTTSWDRTNYFETVPREHLELVLWIESDRMGYMLDTLTAERLEVQRGVVKNERRQSYEDAPYGPSTLVLLDTLFPQGHPYHGAIIGSMSDLSAATMQDVEEFFKAFYSPSNATLAIAGDFEPAAAKALIRRYFHTLPKRPRPPRRVAATPPLAKPVRKVVDEPVELARVSMGWITPPAFSPDDGPLDLATSILAGGKATRLYRRLVVEKKVASEVEASVDPNALGSIASVSAIAATGTDPETLEREIEIVLAELAEKPPTAAELHRAKRGLFVNVLSDLQLLNGGGGESGRAGMLQRFNHYLGDPGHLDDYLKGIQAIGPEQVRAAVQRHLSPGRRATVITRPARPVDP